MMNAAFIVGRIATVPEVRSTGTGKKVTSFRVITTEYYDGEERATGHNITAWGKGLATLFGEKLKKGDAVGFIGRIENRSYEKDGQTFYSSSIVIGEDTRVAIISKAQANRD
jgi:single-strand DNA-binding protein